MTPILDGSSLKGEEEDYPTDWSMLDSDLKVECRQLSMDTFELRSSTHILMVDKEGYDLYRTGAPGRIAFEEWRLNHGIFPQVRDDIENKD